MNNIFLLAGRTGGPFFPLPTIAKNIPNSKAIYLGVRKSFEEKVAIKKNLQIEFLPEAKLSILSFKKQKPSEFLKNLWGVISNGFLLFLSLLKSISLLIRYKPKLIVSTGSFLAVPVIMAMRFTNFFGLTKATLYVHQQDPEPGISNKFGAKFADILSCVFEYTKDNYPQFKNAALIPNPINPENYSKDKKLLLQILASYNPNLANFIKQSSTKPLLFVFGGGGGSQDINLWLKNNFNKVLESFRVIHLLGVFRQNEEMPEDQSYFQEISFVEEMIPVMSLSDLVLCRAGLGSITELRFLQKPTFLVPLPHSHQELNAKLVADQFEILDQKDRPNWLEKIHQSYPLKFKNKRKVSEKDLTDELNNFYQKIANILDK